MMTRSEQKRIFPPMEIREKKIIANRNGIGNATSQWYFTGYRTEQDAGAALVERQKNAADGWDAELKLVDSVEADELAVNAAPHTGDCMTNHGGAWCDCK